MPGSLGSPLNIPDPEQFISPFLIFLPHFSDCLLKIFQCLFHIGWPLVLPVCQRCKTVALMEVRHHPQLASPDLLSLVCLPHLLLCRLFLFLPPLSRRSISAIVELSYLEDVSPTKPVFFPLCSHLSVLSLISLSSPKRAEASPFKSQFFC